MFTLPQHKHYKVLAALSFRMLNQVGHTVNNTQLKHAAGVVLNPIQPQDSECIETVHGCVYEALEQGTKRDARVCILTAPISNLTYIVHVHVHHKQYMYTTNKYTSKHTVTHINKMYSNMRHTRRVHSPQ